MKEFILTLSGIALTVCCWGSYGPTLHRGQDGLGGDRLKPLICVGAAYFIVAIIIPIIILSMSGKLAGSWSMRGISWSVFAGSLGAFGALGIIIALTSGGKPIFVMPLVFGGAPIVSVLVAMLFDRISFRDIGAKFPFFLAGVIMVAVGASMVLVFAPKAKKPHGGSPKPAANARLSPDPAPQRDESKTDDAKEDTEDNTA